MAGHMTEEQRIALEGAFDDLDYDKSGTIPKQELRSALQLIGQIPTLEDTITWFEGTTKEGDFTKDEFLAFIEERVVLKTRDQIDQEVAEAFEKFDNDRDFYITKDEFKKIMTKLGDEPLTDKEADALLEGKDDKLNVAALRSSFDRVDRKKTGWLDINGVRQVLQLIGQNPTTEEMRGYFSKGIRRIDRDTIAEFVEDNVPLKSKATINDEIAEAFAKFNSEENELISQTEFREILTNLGHEPLTGKEADIVINSLNKRRDERLNVEDLSRLLSD